MVDLHNSLRPSVFPGGEQTSTLPGLSGQEVASVQSPIKVEVQTYVGVTGHEDPGSFPVGVKVGVSMTESGVEIPELKFGYNQNIFTTPGLHIGTVTGIDVTGKLKQKNYISTAVNGNYYVLCQDPYDDNWKLKIYVPNEELNKLAGQVISFELGDDLRQGLEKLTKSIDNGVLQLQTLTNKVGPILGSLGGALNILGTFMQKMGRNAI